MTTATLQSRDPELAAVARVMVAQLDPLQRSQLSEALDDPHQLVVLLSEALAPA